MSVPSLSFYNYVAGSDDAIAALPTNVPAADASAATVTVANGASATVTSWQEYWTESEITIAVSVGSTPVFTITVDASGDVVSGNVLATLGNVPVAVIVTSAMDILITNTPPRVSLNSRLAAANTLLVQPSGAPTAVRSAISGGVATSTAWRSAWSIDTLQVNPVLQLTLDVSDTAGTQLMTIECLADGTAPDAAPAVATVNGQVFMPHLKVSSSSTGALQLSFVPLPTITVHNLLQWASDSLVIEPADGGTSATLAKGDHATPAGWDALWSAHTDADVVSFEFSLKATATSSSGSTVLSLTFTAGGQVTLDSDGANTTTTPPLVTSMFDQRSMSRVTLDEADSTIHVAFLLAPPAVIFVNSLPRQTLTLTPSNGRVNGGDSIKLEPQGEPQGTSLWTRFWAPQQPDWQSTPATLREQLSLRIVQQQSSEILLFLVTFVPASGTTTVSSLVSSNMSARPPAFITAMGTNAPSPPTVSIVPATPCMGVPTSPIIVLNSSSTSTLTVTPLGGTSALRPGPLPSVSILPGASEPITTAMQAVWDTLPADATVCQSTAFFHIGWMTPATTLLRGPTVHTEPSQGVIVPVIATIDQAISMPTMPTQSNTLEMQFDPSAATLIVRDVRGGAVSASVLVLAGLSVLALILFVTLAVRWGLMVMRDRRRVSRTARRLQHAELQ